MIQPFSTLLIFRTRITWVIFRFDAYSESGHYVKLHWNGGWICRLHTFKSLTARMNRLKAPATFRFFLRPSLNGIVARERRSGSRICHAWSRILTVYEFYVGKFWVFLIKHNIDKEYRTKLRVIKEFYYLIFGWCFLKINKLIVESRIEMGMDG